MIFNLSAILSTYFKSRCILHLSEQKDLSPEQGALDSLRQGDRFPINVCKSVLHLTRSASKYQLFQLPANQINNMKKNNIKEKRNEINLI